MQKPKIEIIILDGQDLRIKDFTFTTDFSIVFDSLVQNVSTFILNKKDLNGKADDIIVTRGWDKTYVGIIGKLEDKQGVTTLTAYQFSKKFDQSFVDGSKEDVNLGDYIKQVITANLIASEDPLQNIPYLIIENEAKIRGSVTLTRNSGSNVLQVMENIQKAYELMITYEPEYSDNGSIIGVLMTIQDPEQTAKVIKESEKFINDAEVDDGSIGSVNKLVFYPSEDNILYKDTLYYYLLEDGRITDNVMQEGRITPVVAEIDYYSDKDIYGNAQETFIQDVKTRFAETTYNHRISFTLNDNKAVPLKDLDVGEKITFITKEGKTYNSITTKISYSSRTGKATVEMGLKRKSLTDKLAMKGA